MKSTRIEYDLNGEWLLALDPTDVGQRESWFNRLDFPDVLRVRVPSVWDLWVPDYDGVGWYFRDFDAGADWTGRYASLEFEAADYYAEVWLNGCRLGNHEGGYTPFKFDATAALASGANRLAVRIVDPHGPNGYGDFLPKEFPSSKEGGYFSFGGIWGGVKLVGMTPAHITDVFIQPDIRRKRITVTTTTSAPGTVRMRIAGTSYELTAPAGTHLLDFPKHELWSPETPHLYSLECELLDAAGRVVDATSTRFGMREFTLKDNRFYLNNHPILLKGVLHQPDYARSLAAPEAPELARKELELAKAAGFNLVRLHIKTAPKITLDLADEIGILLYEEPPIGWIKNSSWMKDRCMREVREMILRDRNHPSVVIWGMLNESGNAGYKVNGGAQLIKTELCALARSLDPSRVIIDDSGGVNATREPARMMRPYHSELEPYEDLHIYLRAPVDHEIELYLRHSGDPEKLFFLSEFGFGGMEDLEDVIAQYGEERGNFKDARFLEKMLAMAQQGFAERELDRVFGSFREFTAAARELQCDAVRHQIDAIRSNPKVAGYCYTQLCDAGHEFCAGVLDRWRRPKPVFETLKEVQGPLRPLIHVARTNLAPREEVAVTVTLANEERTEGRADLSLQVIGPTNQVLWKKKREMKIPRGGKEIWTGAVSASGSPGVHKFAVRIMQGMTVLGQSSIDFHVVEPVEPCDVEITVLDPQGTWQGKCLKLAKPGTVHAPIHILPPLSNTIRAYPDNDLALTLAEVYGGAVALVFGPPQDWNTLAELIDPCLLATSKDAVGAFLGMYHYVKLHPVFDGLPARSLMRQVYRNIVPPKTFLETSDEDICGTFDTTPIATGHYMMGETTWWGSDILVRRYGSGRIVFTHLRVLEHLGEDPVADRIFVNMLKHFTRRSVPTKGTLPVHQKSVEWLRRERTDRVRHWKTLGMFPNWGDQGHDTAYPPEREIDLAATYPGWYKAIRWKSWYALADEGYLVDLQEAFTPVYEYYPRFDNGTGYAYAEFSSDKRQTVRLKLAAQDFLKVWLNGRLVHESRAHPPLDTLDRHEVDSYIKQGKNTVLVKVSKMPGQFRFSFDLESTTKEPLVLKWWK
ncbi:MAG: hypothetical protein HZB26_18505 [Candidatus Hydrogenedentes bacterium]|nr:hypothetical protein [Candidatus Hydrogenedentota bacterium]